jgi:hypothetical protein
MFRGAFLRQSVRLQQHANHGYCTPVSKHVADWYLSHIAFCCVPQLVDVSVTRTVVKRNRWFVFGVERMVLMQCQFGLSSVLVSEVVNQYSAVETVLSRCPAQLVS